MKDPQKVPLFSETPFVFRGEGGGKGGEACMASRVAGVSRLCSITGFIGCMEYMGFRGSQRLTP